MKKQDKIKQILKAHYGIAKEQAVNELYDLHRRKSSFKRKLNNDLIKDIIAENVPQNERQYFEIAHSFWLLFKQNLEQNNILTNYLYTAKYSQWVTPIRLLITKDGANIEHLREVFQYLRTNEFWQTKIQSTQKLREKFQTIHSQIKTNETRNQNSQTKVSADYFQSVLKDLQSNQG